MTRIFATLLALALGLGALPVRAFTTAAEVRPILNATKGNWIAVREFEGHDLVYFTGLESWRCGLSGVKYGINSDRAEQVWQLEKCYEGEAAPNAMKEEGHLLYITLPLGSVNIVIIKLLYDDGTADTVTFERAKIMTP